MNTSQKYGKALGLALLGVGLLGLGSTRVWAATNTAAFATITVTPAADVSLDIVGTTTYAYGQLDVSAVSVSSVTASKITLRNNGQVNVKVDKRITNQGTWTAAAAPGADTFALYASTSAARPSIADFVLDTHPLFGALNADTQLTGVAGTQPVLATTGGTQTVDLWFRLDMPTSVTTQTAQEITMRFTGVAQ